MKKLQNLPPNRYFLDILPKNTLKFVKGGVRIKEHQPPPPPSDPKLIFRNFHISKN